MNLKWLLALTLVALFMWIPWPRIWRWLKGSRKSYFLEPQHTHSLYWAAAARENFINAKLRVGAERFLGFNPGAIIEINRGPFRRKSAVYGNRFWIVERGWKEGDQELVTLTLRDPRARQVEEALRFINMYPSLQTMIDRIQELEAKIANAELQRHCLWSGIKAILRLIDKDRNQYRSKAAGRIREWLEEIDSSVLGVLPPIQKVEQWKDRFENADLQG